RYASYSSNYLLAMIAVLGVTAAVYPVFERASGSWPLLGRLLVAATLVALARGHGLLVVPIAYAVLSQWGIFTPWSAPFARWLGLTRSYALAALSVLSVLVVAPSIGMFKVVYDSIARLEVEREQFSVVRKLDLRREQIRSAYDH